MKAERNITAKQLAAIAVCTALMAVCSQITVPAAVPFTMQTFAIFFTICFLGEKKAAFSIFAYILLGVAGVPVFSSFGAGLPALFGPTGGYIAGFLLVPPCAYLFGKLTGKSPVGKVVGLVVGLAAVYLFGTLWFIAFSHSAGRNIGFAAALTLCVLPFILPDAIKLILGILLGNKLKKLLHV